MESKNVVSVETEEWQWAVEPGAGDGDENGTENGNDEEEDTNEYEPGEYPEDDDEFECLDPDSEPQDQDGDAAGGVDEYEFDLDMDTKEIPSPRELKPNPPRKPYPEPYNHDQGDKHMAELRESQAKFEAKFKLFRQSLVLDRVFFIELWLDRVVPIYTQLWILGLKSDLNGSDVEEIGTLITELRQFFLCSVCDNLLSPELVVSKDMTADCESPHPTCKECEGKPFKVRCEHCPEIPTSYEEHVYIKTLVKSYKDCCVTILRNDEWRRLVKIKAQVDPNFANPVIDIVSEGAIASIDPSVQKRFQELDATEVARLLGFCLNWNDPIANTDSQNENIPQENGTAESNAEAGVVNDNEQTNVDHTGTAAETSTEQSLEDPTEHKSQETDVKRLEVVTPPPPPQVLQWEDVQKVFHYSSGTLASHALSSYPSTRFLPAPIVPIITEIHPPSPVSTAIPITQHAMHSQMNHLKTSFPSIMGAAGMDKPQLKSLKVKLPRLPSTSTTPKPTLTTSKPIRKNCRCGNAAQVPGKLTCCGQRCPCYVDRRSCAGCKCKGCRNPHLPGDPGAPSSSSSAKNVLPNASQTQTSNPIPALTQKTQTSNPIVTLTQNPSHVFQSSVVQSHSTLAPLPVYSTTISDSLTTGFPPVFSPSGTLLGFSSPVQFIVGTPTILQSMDTDHNSPHAAPIPNYSTPSS